MYTIICTCSACYSETKKLNVTFIFLVFSDQMNPNTAMDSDNLWCHYTSLKPNDILTIFFHTVLTVIQILQYMSIINFIYLLCNVFILMMFVLSVGLEYVDYPLQRGETSQKACPDYVTKLDLNVRVQF